MYRLNTEVKVFMGFIIPSDAVARLINMGCRLCRNSIFRMSLFKNSYLAIIMITELKKSPNSGKILVFYSILHKIMVLY